MLRILGKKEVKLLMNLPLALQAVEEAYLQKQSGAGSVWPMVFHEFVPGQADLDIKSGNLDQAGVFGLKLVSWFSENPAQGLPALMGTSLLCDRNTGAPTALLNAGPITDFRTGAAGAIGAQLLARPESRQLTMVGCGALAPYLIAATLWAMPGICRVRLVNPHNPVHAKERLAAIAERVAELLHQGRMSAAKEKGLQEQKQTNPGQYLEEAAETYRLRWKQGVQRTVELTASVSLEQAIRESDVILTATPARQPLFPAAWVKPGTHISCVGADMNGKQELDEALLLRARVFGDDLDQCRSVGECEKAWKSGAFVGPEAEIGAVLAGVHAGRQSAEEITIFDSTGIALQDLACGAALLKQAEAENIGFCAEL